jgi:hypothetical protein
VLSQENDVNTNSRQGSSRKGEELLDIERDQEKIHQNDEQRLMIMMLLIKMCETMDHTYLTSAQQVIKFAKVCRVIRYDIWYKINHDLSSLRCMCTYRTGV